MASLCMVCKRYADLSFYDSPSNSELLFCQNCYNDIKKKRGY